MLRFIQWFSTAEVFNFILNCENKKKIKGEKIKNTRRKISKISFRFIINTSDNDLPLVVGYVVTYHYPGVIASGSNSTISFTDAYNDFSCSHFDLPQLKTNRKSLLQIIEEL